MLEATNLSYYLIVINPSSDISKDVRDIKFNFASKYGRYASLHSLPHITITNFIQRSYRDEKVLKCISGALKGISEFDVSLSNFNFFEKNNTFFIDIENKNLLVNLYDLLKQTLCTNWVPPSFFKKTYTPHLTVGRKLSNSQFRVAQNEFDRRPYAKSFRASSLTVLRKNSIADPWKCAAEFSFNPTT